MEQNLHERFDRKETIKTSSDRMFCLVITLALAAVTSARMRHGDHYAILLALTLYLLGVSLANPSLLAPINRLWTNFGLWIARFTSPIVLALLYVATIIPIGLLMRMMGKRPLKLKYEPAAPTYWISRNTDIKPGDNMNHQF